MKKTVKTVNSVKELRSALNSASEINGEAKGLEALITIELIEMGYPGDKIKEFIRRNLDYLKHNIGGGMSITDAINSIFYNTENDRNGLVNNELELEAEEVYRKSAGSSNIIIRDPWISYIIEDINRASPKYAAPLAILMGLPNSLEPGLAYEIATRGLKEGLFKNLFKRLYISSNTEKDINAMASLFLRRFPSNKVYDNYEYEETN